MKKFNFLFILLLVFSIALFTSCKKDNPVASTGFTTYVGVAADTLTGGPIRISLSGDTASGIWRRYTGNFPQDTSSYTLVQMNGTFVNGIISVSGGGFTITGSPTTAGTFSGSYNHNGTFGLVGSVSTNQGFIYIGLHERLDSLNNPDTTSIGIIAFGLNNNVTAGIGTGGHNNGGGANKPPALFTGTRSGNIITSTASDGQGNLITIKDTLNGNTISGTFSSPKPEHGTISASLTYTP